MKNKITIKDIILYIFSRDMIYADLEKSFDTSFLTPAEAAVRCSTSTAVINAWIDSGRIRTVTLKGNTYIWIKDLCGMVGHEGDNKCQDSLLS